ncbi:MAG: 1-acyl-sn-glycerol-3-phosphate acyltransferase [Imperialibacter sp.]|uniref:1-acyl-sn-glycerol-3-phosphate acyltransferase n=1 Tax=Imperialibacter sp. TaxID=2038411 RepID=UPI0032EE7C69
MRAVFRFLFWLLGWEAIGTKPTDKKFIIVVAPHTSFWDFFVGVAARSIFRLDTKYLGKKELFWFPLSVFLRLLGGYPVDRTNAAGLVESVVDLFDSKEAFSIALAPEGTRKKVDKLKTGFWRIAKAANIPIVLVSFDFKRRRVEMLEPFMPGDMETDMERIMAYYKGITGKRPWQDLR